MAGRGFTGSDARIRFSATGGRGVLRTVQQIGNAMMELSGEAQRYSHLQERQNRLTAQIENSVRSLQNAQDAATTAYENRLAAINASIRRRNELTNKSQDLQAKYAVQTQKWQEQEVQNTERLRAARENLNNSSRQFAQNDRERAATRAQGLSRIAQQTRAVRESLREFEDEDGDNQFGNISQRVDNLRELRKLYRELSAEARSYREQAAQQDRPEDAASILAEAQNMESQAAGIRNLIGLREKQTQLTEKERIARAKEAEAIVKIEAEIAKLERKEQELRATRNIGSQEYNRALQENRDAITRLQDEHARKVQQHQRANAKDRRDLEARQKAINNLEAAYDNLEFEMEQMKGRTMRLAQSVWTLITADELLKKRVLQVGTAMAGIALIGAFAKITKDAIALRVAIERVEKSLSALAGSAAAAEALMSDLFDLGQQVPVDVNKLFEGARAMMAVGTSTKEVKEDLKAIAIVAAAVNQPVDQLATIYSEIRNKNRLYREDVLQFSRRGIPLMQELADIYGIQRDELDKLVSEGAVKFEHFQFALQKMVSTGGKFGELAAEILDTASGKAQKFQNATVRAYNSLGRFLVESPEAQGVLELLESLSDSLDEVGSKAEKASQKLDVFFKTFLVDLEGREVADQLEMVTEKIKELENSLFFEMFDFTSSVEDFQKLKDELEAYRKLKKDIESGEFGKKDEAGPAPVMEDLADLKAKTEALKTIEEIIEGLAGQEATRAKIREKMVEHFDKEIEAAKSEEQKAAALEKQQKVLEKFDSMIFDEAIGGVNREIQKLQDELAGISEARRALMDANATPQQFQELDARERELEVLKEQRRVQQEMIREREQAQRDFEREIDRTQAEADKIRESLGTPFEKAVREAERLEQLVANTDLTADEAAEAMAIYAQNAIKAADAHETMSGANQQMWRNIQNQISNNAPESVISPQQMQQLIDVFSGTAQNTTLLDVITAIENNNGGFQ